MEHTLQKVPYLLIIGDKEEETSEVSVRTRDGIDLGSMSIECFLESIDKSIAKLGRKE